MESDLGGRMMSGWGWSESPLIDGPLLLCTPGTRESGVAALDKKSGAVKWRSALPELGPAGKDGAGYASLVVAEAAGQRQYVTLMGRGLVGVSARDGKYLWSYNRAASSVANCSSPVVSGDLVFGSSAYKHGIAGLVKLTAAGDRNPGRPRPTSSSPRTPCRTTTAAWCWWTAILYGGHGQNAGLPVCIELKTGRVAWRADQSPGGGSAAVLYADGQLYFRYERGQMALIKASPDAYTLAGTFPIGSANGKHWAHPVIHDGRLYLRDQDALLCYELRAK
jgi:outer membrane protein assembly factor BamB